MSRTFKISLDIKKPDMIQVDPITHEPVKRLTPQQAYLSAIQRARDYIKRADEMKAASKRSAVRKDNREDNSTAAIIARKINALRSR